MYIEGVADAKRPPVSGCRVESAVKSTLYVFQSSPYLSYCGAPLIREFKPCQRSLKELDAPILLESLYFPADVGVAGMEALSSPNEIPFLCQDQGAHKSLSGDMGEHVSPWAMLGFR